MDGIAHLELLIVESFTPYKSMMKSILPPAVGWVVAATLVVIFPKDSFLSVNCISCLVVLKLGYLSIDYVVWLGD